MNRYLLEDYRGKGRDERPTLKVIYGEEEIFNILQDKPVGIAISKISEHCEIDWT